MVTYPYSISRNVITRIKMASPFIPPKTISKMKSLSVSEDHVLDVFNNGTYKTLPSGMKVAIKKYNGYEVGVGYTQRAENGEYVIIAVWKRERK